MIGMFGMTGVMVFLVWKMWHLKKDIYDVGNVLERNLDRLVSGKKLENYGEVQDTLLGKLGERLTRVAHMWEKRDLEARREREMIQELISDISHQTKTPIANQKIYLEMLREEPMSQEGKEFLEKLEGQVEKLDFLLDSMVKTSRLETGTIQIQKRDTDLVKTLLHAVEAIVPKASEKGIELHVNCEEEFLLRHDQKWTEEAIFNVLDNAVKYTKAGGSIHIQVNRQEIFSKISIRDTGKGIALERQGQIFGRFYREPEVHSQAGIGIGLYLTRKIIELQKGYVEVYSQVGEGADFRIYLPND